MNKKTEKKKPLSADDEQQMYLELQKSLASQNKGVNIALVAGFFAFIYIFTILFWALPDKTLLEEENRSAATFPAVTLEKIISGTYDDEFTKYMADQFPFRNTFVGISAACEQALFKGQNNGVFIGKDDWLIARFDKIDEVKLKTNIMQIAKFEKEAEEEGIEVYFAVAGRTADIADSKMPSLYGTEASDNAWAALDAACKENSLEYIDLKTPLKAKFDAGEDVYYRTDHHWTTLGAYYGYSEIAKAAELESHPLNHYTVEVASEEFFGTTWRTAGAKWVPGEKMEFFRWEEDENCITTLNPGTENETSFIGLYDRSYLEKTDKYSAFLGEKVSRCDITFAESRQAIVVVKDSFAHCLVPFLAEDYNVVMINEAAGNIDEICESVGATKVIFLYNLDTLQSSSLTDLMQNFRNK